MTLDELVKEIMQDKADQYSAFAIRLYNRIKDKEELREELVDLTYEFIEQVVAMVLSYIYDTYHIEVKPLDKEELKKLFYSKDGKTMEQRIDEYVSLDKMAFIHHICMFYSTESATAMNKVMFLKLKSYFKFFRVISTGACAGCCSSASAWTDWNPTDQVEIADLPPYHPDCGCAIQFSERI